MSTNKTKNYRLHSWAAGDDFLRTEFNENFAKLDEALHAGLAAGEAGLRDLIVTGSYTGDGADTRTIQLGFTPRLVFVITDYAKIQDGAYTYGGMALKGQPGRAVAVTEGGFTVRYYSGGGYVLSSNGETRKYYYWALR